MVVITYGLIKIIYLLRSEVSQEARDLMTILLAMDEIESTSSINSKNEQKLDPTDLEEDDVPVEKFVFRNIFEKHCFQQAQKLGMFIKT